MKTKNKTKSSLSVCTQLLGTHSINHQSACKLSCVSLVSVLSNNLLSNNRGSVGRVNRNLVVIYTSQNIYLRKMCCLLKQLKLVRLCPHAIPRRGALR